MQRTLALGTLTMVSGLGVKVLCCFGPQPLGAGLLRRAKSHYAQCKPKFYNFATLHAGDEIWYRAVLFAVCDANKEHQGDPCGRGGLEPRLVILGNMIPMIRDPLAKCSASTNACRSLKPHVGRDPFHLSQVE